MPIENLRSLLVIGLCVVLFLMWQAWIEDHSPEAPLSPATTAPAGPEPSAGAGSPTAAISDVPEIPEQPPSSIDSAQPVSEEGSPANRVRVRTDVFDLVMDSRAIYRLELLNYPLAVDEPQNPFPLLNESAPNIFVVETGVLGSNGEPNRESVFTPARDEYVLESGRDSLGVVFTFKGPNGIELTKTYTFHRGSYVVDVTYRVKNATGQPWSGRMYGQFRRTQVADSGGLFRIYTYTGGVISSPEKPYEKIAFDDMLESPLSRDVQGGWAAMIQHYFAGAWIPSPDIVAHYYSKALDGAQYLLGLYVDQSVSPGETKEMKLTAYIGPKIQKRMEALAPGLRRTVDFGWLFFIAEPLFWLLDKIHGYLGNWGWSIIVLTMLIKLAFFHLSATSYKSMARMRKLQPRMVQLKERYGTDRQRMNQAMMELYKKEKINPLGGCLPILVQIPVFIALYWVLLESVELRQAPFIFWLNDLSQHDRFFVLPILMGVSMLLQQRLNPTPPDPVQAKIMMALPFVFTFFFLFFPSGLVLYWFVNNVLSIAQQWVITKRIEAAP